jgi:neutral amino acid transport system ATP-binding protein
MTDDPTDHPGVIFGATSGGGGAGAARAATADHVNPVAGVFDDVVPEPGSAKPDPILVASGVVKNFGGLTAVDVDHLEIQRGAITALIGPNGAGKTTFFNLLTGFDEMDHGRVSLDGKQINKVPPHRLAKQGMVRTFQLTKALSRMKVIDNMKLGATGQRGESFWASLVPTLWSSQEAEVEAQADALLDRFNMTHMREQFAGTLSGGQRKLIEMARALMTDPKLVMLDEPMAGVNPALTQSLLGHVKGLRSEGRTVIFVEHDMDVVRDISDWVVVMAEGQIIAEGTPDDISANTEVIDAYLGKHHDSDLFDDEEALAEVFDPDVTAAALEGRSGDEVAHDGDADDQEDDRS